MEVLTDPDTWWHLAAGRLILSELRIPGTDPFSHSLVGAPWHAHEWGAEVLMWSAYKLGGWSGLIALCAAAAGAASAILVYFIQRHLSALVASVAALGTLACLLPSAWARPHLLVLPIFVYWVVCMLRSADAGRAPSPWLALMMVIWANMHGSFLLGIGMMGAIGFEAVWRSNDRRKSLKEWALFGIAAVAASLLTPFGISGYTYPLYVSSMTVLSQIGEWANSTVGNSLIFMGVLLAGLLALLVTGARFRPIRAALFVGLIFLALKHRRHQFIFAFIGTLLASGPLGRALSKKRARRPPSGIDRPMFLILGAVAIGAVAARLVIPADADKHHTLPTGVISNVPAELRRLPVFNHYNYGGPLIFYGIRPFIDGRADMYGDKFMAEYSAAEGGGQAAWNRIERTHGIQWAILPRDSLLVPILQKHQWRFVTGDSKAGIYVRARADVRP